MAVAQAPAEIRYGQGLRGEGFDAEAVGVSARRGGSVRDEGGFMGARDVPGLHQPGVPRAQARRAGQVAGRGGPAAPKRVLPQDWDAERDAGNAVQVGQQGRLDGDVRPQGRLQRGWSSPVRPQVHDLQCFGRVLPVQRGPVRLGAVSVCVLRDSASLGAVDASAVARGHGGRSASSSSSSSSSVETTAARRPRLRLLPGALRRTRLQGKTAVQRAKLRAPELEANAPRLRSKVLRPGKKSGRGVRMLWYVDDLLLLAATRAAALEQRDFVERSLALLGLQRNEAKGVWEPSLVVKHLGLTVDLQEGTFKLTEERQAKLRRLSAAIGAKAARERRWVPVRDLAAITGLAQSAYLAIPPAKFYLRELHNVIASRTSWNGPGARVRLTKQALRDLRWWRDVPSKWAARPIWRSADSAFIHCDASGSVGWGGVLNGLRPTRGFWRESQMPLHITHKELLAVRFTVETFIKDLAGKRVLLWEDNQGVVAILSQVTSKSRALMTELRKLWWLMDTNDITIRAKYIRSAANVWADALSRDRDGQGDWMLDPALFRQLDREGPSHTVDRFATANNHQVPRFNALMEGPGVEAVDAMAQDDAAWRRETNWCNPPWGLLASLALKLRRSGAAATVVAPTWRSAPWYGEMLRMCDSFRVEPARRDLFRPGNQGSARGVGSAGWSVTVFRFALRHAG